MDIVAGITFRHLQPDAAPAEIRIEIGRPFANPDGDWSCPVTLPSSGDTPQLVHGIDPLQTLCLTMDLIRQELEAYRGTLYWPGIDGPVPLDAYRLGSGFLPE